VVHPSAALPHVFERFYHSDKARSRETGGSGLGLSIVKAIATSYGGNVLVRSVETRGTVVIFSLPAADVAAEKQLARSAS
jgi:signal transduction histidine kinase